MTEFTTEQMLIGIAINSGESLKKQLEIGIDASHFSQKYTRLFQAMQNLIETQGYYDVALLSQIFPDHINELVEFSEKGATAVNVEYYAKEFLIQKTCLNALSVASDIVKRICNRKPFDEIDDIVVDSKALSEHFLNSTVMQEYYGETSNEILQELTTDIDESQTGRENAFQTGFKFFDRVTGGLKKGSYVVIAARSKVGKTSFWLSLLKEPILDGRKITAFSIEMDGKELFNRLICSMARIKPEKVRDGKMNESEIDAYVECQKRLYNTNVTVFGKRFNDFKKVEKILKDRAKKGLCEIAVIDYIQRYHIDHSRSRYQDLSEITNRIQDICKTLNIPIIVIAQLNRAFVHAQADDGMAYIKDCGGIEQDADIIGILTRDRTNEHEHPTSNSQPNAMLKIQGNRFGSEADIQLLAELQYCRFTEI